ncbi:MAG: LysR family transcriptional regulator [Beijerinckiaceae bacterium]|nr:LysR family transcriptional regulator [Beijerinckiaceae bacterium]
MVRSFTAVVRTGNLTRAAKALKTTQPTIGRHIRQLESRIGEILFERTGEGFRPTARATELYEKAAGLDDAIEAFTLSMGGGSQDLVGTVRITAPVFFGMRVLPPILTELLVEHPGLEVELSINDQSENLLRREADIAVRLFPPQQDDLIARRLGMLSVGLFASRRYFNRVGTSLPNTPGDLEGHVIIGEGNAHRALAFASANKLALTKKNVRFRSDSMSAQYEALRVGAGIGPALACIANRDPDLIPILPDLVVATIPLWIVAHDDLPRNPRMRTTFDHLVVRLSELMAVSD